MYVPFIQFSFIPELGALTVTIMKAAVLMGCHVV